MTDRAKGFSGRSPRTTAPTTAASSSTSRTVTTSRPADRRRRPDLPVGLPGRGRQHSVSTIGGIGGYCVETVAPLVCDHGE